VWFADAQTTTATTQLGGADTGTFVAVEIPDELAARFLIAGSPSEVTGRGREFCLPAEVANRLPRFSLTNR
jgi:hypothetical protein